MIKKTCKLLKNLGGVVYHIKEEVISVAPFHHLWVKFLWRCPPCLLWLVETLKKYCSFVYASTTSNRPGDTRCLCSGLRAKRIKLSHPSHLPFHISSHSVSHMLLNDLGALCTAYTANTPYTTEIHHTEEILSGYSRVWDGEGSQTAVEPEWEKERAQCTLQNEQSSQQLLLQSIHYDWKHNNCLKFCYTTFFNLNCLNQTRMRSSYFLCV